MHRFFVLPEMIKGSMIEIDKEQAHHIEKVLRLKPGASLVLFDGLGNEYICKLHSHKDGLMLAEIEKQYFLSNEPSTKVILAQAIAKGEKMDYVIQKAVEIGVTTIIPFLSERTVVTLTDQKAAQKITRWQTIAREACKQSRRNVIPEVKPVMIFQQLITSLQHDQFAIMLYEGEEQIGLKDVLKEHKGDLLRQSITIIVGPEGGFSAAESRLAQDNSIKLVTLGSRILRTETAGLVAASILLYEGGDLG